MGEREKGCREQRESERETETERQTYRREREISNVKLKQLFYKDCSLGLVKNLTTSPC